MLTLAADNTKPATTMNVALISDTPDETAQLLYNAFNALDIEADINATTAFHHLNGPKEYRDSIELCIVDTCSGANTTTAHLNNTIKHLKEYAPRSRVFVLHPDLTEMQLTQLRKAFGMLPENKPQPEQTQTPAKNRPFTERSFYSRLKANGAAAKSDLTQITNELAYMLSAEQPAPTLKPLNDDECGTIKTQDVYFVLKEGRAFYKDHTPELEEQDGFRPISASIPGLIERANPDKSVTRLSKRGPSILQSFDESHQGETYNQYPSIALSDEEVKMIEVLLASQKRVVNALDLRMEMYEAPHYPRISTVNKIAEGLSDKLAGLVGERAAAKIFHFSETTGFAFNLHEEVACHIDQYGFFIDENH